MIEWEADFVRTHFEVRGKEPHSCSPTATNVSKEISNMKKVAYMKKGARNGGGAMVSISIGWGKRNWHIHQSRFELNS